MHTSTVKLTAQKTNKQDIYRIFVFKKEGEKAVAEYNPVAQQGHYGFKQLAESDIVTL